MASLLKRLRIGIHRNLIRFGIDVRKTRSDRKLLEQVAWGGWGTQVTLSDFYLCKVCETSGRGL